MDVKSIDNEKYLELHTRLAEGELDDGTHFEVMLGLQSGSLIYKFGEGRYVDKFKYRVSLQTITNEVVDHYKKDREKG